MTVEFLPPPSPSAPHARAFPQDHVGLFAWQLDRPASETDALAAVLSADEQARAARLQAPGGRARFTAAHAFRRAILARACHRPPETLRFIAGPHGKPALADSPLQFSAARSAAVAILAVSPASAIGADIEYLSMPPNADAVLRANASPAEIEAFFSLPEAARRQAFFRWWTSKEAILKALGAGLTLPLSSFDVALDAAYPALLASRLDALQGAWTLLTLAPCQGYIGTLAMQRTDCPVRAWRLDSFAQLQTGFRK